MIYTKDHPPPQVRVWKAGKQALINLGDERTRVSVRENRRMSTKNVLKALQIVACWKNGGKFMATHKWGKWTYTDEQLEEMFKQADKRGKERLKREPRAARAEYDAKSRRIVIELLNGCALMVPVDLMQGLRGATDEELSDFELMPRGFDLHWKALDAQFTVAGLLAGIFGTKAWMAELGRAGGRSTSAGKRAAARANGAKGGRPRTSTRAKTTKRRRSVA